MLGIHDVGAGVACGHCECLTELCIELEAHLDVSIEGG